MIYEIKFKADLTEDDVRAMQKYFFDTMNESMEIYDLWDLELTEVKDDNEPSIEKMQEYSPHIDDIVDGLMACETIEEVEEYLDTIPRKFGEWWVDEVNGYYEVTNEWWDSQTEELRCNTYELDIEVEDDDE